MCSAVAHLGKSKLSNELELNSSEILVLSNELERGGIYGMTYGRSIHTYIHIYIVRGGRFSTHMGLAQARPNESTDVRMPRKVQLHSHRATCRLCMMTQSTKQLSAVVNSSSSADHLVSTGRACNFSCRDNLLYS